LFFFQRNQFDRDLEDELRFHEEMKAHALADADGMSGDEARAAARRRIGNPLRLREQSREPWSFATVETFAQDVRHALRLMRRDPAFTFTALATLALGIGLNTAIFSVAYGVLWRPLPYPNPDRLVIVSSAQQTGTGVKTFSTWPPVTYEGLRQRVITLDHLAAYTSIDAQLTGRGEPLQLPALDVSPNFFATLGVSPVRGRAFLSGAAAPDDDRAAIVSDTLGLAIDLAVREYEPERLIVVGRCRRDIAVLQAMNVTTLEPRRGCAEDEIDMTCDIAIFEILPAAIQKDRVLPAQKPAATEAHTIAVHSDSQSLSHRPGRVFESEIFKADIVGIDHGRRRPKGADRLLIRTNHIRVQVVSQNRFRRVFPHQSKEPLFMLDVD
jgi:hypothetical protein